MAGRIVHGRDAREDRVVRADVVVCGSGAGGSMAARELARGGLEVVLLEEGEDLVPSDFDQREDTTIPRLFQQAGGRRTDDLAITILGGRGLGGSTLHNTNLIKRTPPEILLYWRNELGIETVGPDEMAPIFGAVERDLGVRRIPDERINLHNQIVRRGVERLRFQGAVLSHNRDERCIGSGFCELGCTYDGKLNARRVLVPEAIAAGATVYTDARVDRVRLDVGAIASGVDATLLDARGKRRARLEVRANVVCLAGSAIGSAAIALASDLPDPNEQIGTCLRIHPAALVAGVFEERVEAWRGIPQSYECTEFLDLRPRSQRRVWIVPSFAHPVGIAAMTAGFGPSLMRQMRNFPRLAALAALVHDETEGRVYLDGDRVKIAYEPNASDRDQLALGAREAGRILLAAGAREVQVPAPRPIVARTEAELGEITADRFLPHDARITAVHPMGTMRMGPDPATSVVDPHGRHHHVRNLYLVDGSLFPTSIGAPPQLSIYAFASKVARHILGTRTRDPSH